MELRLRKFVERWWWLYCVSVYADAALTSKPRSPLKKAPKYSTGSWPTKVVVTQQTSHRKLQLPQKAKQLATKKHTSTSH